MHETNHFTYKNLNKKQPIFGILLIILLTLFGAHLNTLDAALSMYLFSGVLMGAILVRGRFGFAGGIKRIYYRGEGSLSKALLLMLLVTSTGFMAYQWWSAQNGAVPFYLADANQTIIPGTQRVFPVDISLILGAFLFGFGMIIADGCAGKILTDTGEGQGHALLTLIFFIIGSIPGDWLRAKIEESMLGKFQYTFYFPEKLGFFGGFLFSLLLIGIVYFMIVRYENKRRKEKTYLRSQSDWLAFEKPIDELETKQSLFFRTYHKLFIERFTFQKTVLLFSIMAIFTLLFSGNSWGVTIGFSETGLWAFEKLGITFQAEVFTDFYTNIQNGLFTSGTNVQNFGLVAGALLAFLLAGRFHLNFHINKKEMLYSILSGGIMGFGSRLANGATAGALYSSMASFSLSGWVVLLFMTLGALTSLKLLAGKSKFVPKR